VIRLAIYPPRGWRGLMPRYGEAYVQLILKMDSGDPPACACCHRVEVRRAGAWFVAETEWRTEVGVVCAGCATLPHLAQEIAFNEGLDEMEELAGAQVEGRA